MGSTTKDDVPIDVTWEDQRRICTFSRLHRRIQHLMKRQQLLKDDLEKLSDACDEVMICDGVKYVFGEAFVDLESDRAGELLEEEKLRMQGEQEATAIELKELRSALDDLKAQLYAKFGSQIYLEDNEPSSFLSITLISIEPVLPSWAMLCEKPGGPMHDALRRALEELRSSTNPYTAITFITVALQNSERIKLPSERDYVDASGTNSVVHSGVTPPVTPLSGSGSVGVGSAFAGTTSIRQPSNSSSAAHSQHSATQVGCPRTPVAPSPVRYSGTAGRAVGGPGAAASAFIQGFVVGGSVSADSFMGSAAQPSCGLGDTSERSAICGVGSGGVSRTKTVFNAVQVIRLLLLRADAFSLTKQHERALQDALSAVEISQGRSPEAYFTAGREHLRLFCIPESVAAFEKGEACLLRCITGTEISLFGENNHLSEEEDYWAQRGFEMSEVKRLCLTRGAVEEGEPHGHNGNNNAGTSICAPGSAATTKGRVVAVANSVTNAHHASAKVTHLTLTDMNDLLTAAPSAYQLPNDLGEGSSSRLPDPYLVDLSESGGMTLSELAMWKRLSSEARALLAMRKTHTVPLSVHPTTLSLLDRRVTAVRGGLALSIENTLDRDVHLVGCSAPDGTYHARCSFPPTIAMNCCGFGLLQPRSWGGFSGCVCYAISEHLCCFFYFDSPLVGAMRCGVHFQEYRVSDMWMAFVDLNGGGAAGIQGTTSNLMNDGSSGGLCSPFAGKIPTSSNFTFQVPEGGTSSANRSSASRLIKVPPTNTWATSTTVTHGNRVLKATACISGNHILCFSIGVVLPMRLECVELLPALEYAGPVVLKKLSAVSYRFRKFVNNLPPPMFYGGGRRAYPDYCLPMDRRWSPWHVYDKEPVRWRILFDSHSFHRDDFYVVDEGNVQHSILCISADAQSRLSGTLYLGDRRSPHTHFKESRVPFSDTVYLSSTMGQTYACCYTNANGHLTMAYGNGGSSSKPDDILYTVVKKMVTHDTATGGPQGEGSGARVARSPLVFPRDDHACAQGRQGSGTVGGDAVRVPPSSPLSGTQRNVSHPGYLVIPSKSSPSYWSNGAHYSVFCSPRYIAEGTPSGLLGRTGAPEELVAEIKIRAIGFQQIVRGSHLVEITMCSGADGFLMTALAFCRARWDAQR